MSENLVTNVLDALQLAKKTEAILPPLPPRVKPVHMHILDALARIRDCNGNARITDINNALHYLLPNTTKFINELCQIGVVVKEALPSDKRVVLVRTTALGESYIEEFILAYHEKLQSAFESIGETKCLEMVDTLSQIFQAITQVYRPERKDLRK